MSDAVPRRFRFDLMTPAELAITNAVEAVEALPPDVRLTDAVVLLGQARDKVADYVDENAGPQHAVEAQAAYDAYVKSAGGKSLATGQTLPSWDNLPLPIKRAWGAAADAVIEIVVGSALA